MAARSESSPHPYGNQYFAFLALFATFALKFPAPHGKFDLVRTIISIGADGAPVIDWEPDLNKGGTKHERVYTVECKANLTDKSWAPTNSASRFVRVKVEMP